MGSEPLDFSVAASLLPKLVKLTQSRTSLSSGVNNDDESRAHKLELGKEATELRETLNKLRAQIEGLPAGDLSVEDQLWLIKQAEKKLEEERTELSRLVKLVHGVVKDKGVQHDPKMETD